MTIENQTNRAMAPALKKRQPKEIVTEKIGLNIHCLAKNKEISLQVSD